MRNECTRFSKPAWARQIPRTRSTLPGREMARVARQHLDAELVVARAQHERRALAVRRAIDERALDLDRQARRSRRSSPPAPGRRAPPAPARVRSTRATACFRTGEYSPSSGKPATSSTVARTQPGQGLRQLDAQPAAVVLQVERRPGTDRADGCPARARAVPDAPCGSNWKSRATAWTGRANGSAGAAASTCTWSKPGDCSWMSDDLAARGEERAGGAADAHPRVDERRAAARPCGSARTMAADLVLSGRERQREQPVGRCRRAPRPAPSAGRRPRSPSTGCPTSRRAARRSCARRPPAAPPGRSRARARRARPARTCRSR